MHYQTTTCVETVGELSFTFHCLENFEKTVDALFVELERTGNPNLLEDLCPYFGVIWPGSRVLAKEVLTLGAQLKGRRVLEIGCGLALPSFVAAKLGAKVTVSDQHPQVPQFLAKNMALNPGISLQYQHLDWHEEHFPRNYDWILGSDILYEKKDVEPLVSFLHRALKGGGKAILLDPDRSYWQLFLQKAKAVGFQTSVHPIAGTSSLEPKSTLLLSLTRDRL